MIDVGWWQNKVLEVFVDFYNMDENLQVGFHY